MPASPGPWRETSRSGLLTCSCVTGLAGGVSSSLPERKALGAPERWVSGKHQTGKRQEIKGAGTYSRSKLLNEVGRSFSNASLVLFASQQALPYLITIAGLSYLAGVGASTLRARPTSANTVPMIGPAIKPPAREAMARDIGTTVPSGTFKASQ
jgi:hypothetical protein